MMAIESDVVDQLVKVTADGSLKWDPILWDGDGVAKGWATSKSNFLFTLYDYHKNDRRLYVNTPESRASVSLFNSEILDHLVEVLRKMPNGNRPSKDAILGKVLSLLEN